LDIKTNKQINIRSGEVVSREAGVWEGNKSMVIETGV